MNRRTLALLFAGIVLTVTTVTVGTAAGGSSERRSHEPNRVKLVGEETFEANALIQSTFRFSPERLFPHTGDRVHWVDRDQADQPHTVTIVKPRQLPSSADEAFTCGPCNKAIDAHFSGGPPKLRVNFGEPGLDRAGDSLLILPDERISANVSAPAGTKLYYVCAIHPWMQGKLVVG
jgi:plastocyanin